MKYQSRIIYSTELAFKNKGQINFFKQKQEISCQQTSFERSVLEKKKVFHGERIDTDQKLSSALRKKSIRKSKSEYKI